MFKARFNVSVSYNKLVRGLSPIACATSLALVGCGAESGATDADLALLDSEDPAALTDAAANEDVGELSQALGSFSTVGFPLDVLPVEIMNVNSGKCLDVGNADPASGTDLVQFTCTGAKNQTWFLTRMNGSTDYQIRSGLGGARNMDVEGGGTNNGARIQIYNSAVVQKWGVRKQADGNFEIVAKAADKCLDVANASTANSAAVQQFTCGGGLHQRWVIKPRTSALSLIARHSSRCVDVASASAANNANVQQFDCSGATNQKWYLQGAGVTNGIQYWSVQAQHSNMCLDVAGASLANNANVQQFQCNGGENQKWQISTVTAANGNGYTVLKNKLSGKCLDVAGAATGNNANLQQFTCGSTDNQYFYWANYTERHIQLVPVAKTDGTGVIAELDSDVQAHVARVNSIFGPYGAKLIYTPASDRSAKLNNDVLYTYDGESSSTGTCPDGSVGTALQCGTRHAANFPGKVVVYSRPGNGQSWGDRNHIVMGDMKSATTFPCAGSSAPDTQWLGHEFGHYMGLAHPHTQSFANIQAANSFFQAGGNVLSVFENDQLSDTGPDPLIGTNGCLAPNTATGVVTLVNTANNNVPAVVNTDNVMGYYYNAGAKISSGQQAGLVRATSYARYF